MSPRRTAAARLALALVLGLLPGIGARAAHANGPVRLAAGEVQALMAEVAAASNARDVNRLAALLAPDCRIELRTEIGGREAITLYTRAEYVAMLTSGYASMADLSDYDYHVDHQQVTIEPDDPAATVVSDVSESFTFQARHLTTHSEETARVERRDGRAMVVAVESLTRGER
jgi:hypothetical protein